MQKLIAKLCSCGCNPAVVVQEGHNAQQWFSEAETLLSQHLTSRDRDLGPEHLAAEFAALCQKQNESKAAAQLACNRNKNRYTNVLPFDHNRVKLTEPDPDQDATDYINASLVVCKHDSLFSGILAPCKYVATQGPLSHTVHDMWRMVMQQRLTTIIMLTRTTECQNQRCAQYFPELPGVTEEFGSYSVTTLAVDKMNDDVDVRQIRVTRRAKSSGQEGSRTSRGQPAPVLVHHYHYHRWPDFGVPNQSQALRQLSLTLWRQGRQAQVVHCSAGIGRTGTYIAADTLLRRMWALATSGRRVNLGLLKQALDVPAMVTQLRLMRSGMVQTAEQYALVYQILLEEASARKNDPCEDLQPVTPVTPHFATPDPSHRERGTIPLTSHTDVMVQPSGAPQPAPPSPYRPKQYLPLGLCPEAPEPSTLLNTSPELRHQASPSDGDPFDEFLSSGASWHAKAVAPMVPWGA